MGPCDITAAKRILVHSESQFHVKKSKRSPETPWPPSKLETNISDLPESVLVEILCRLPHNKFVFQCKCVCKRWLSLISDEKFQCRFLWLQSLQNQKLEPMRSTLIFKDAKDKREYFILPELELPMFKTHDFSLRFLPCFEDSDYRATDDDIYEEPIVVGTCNDLVLCCDTIIFPVNYYICNPYTKQFVSLPPTPRRYIEVRVGFICDPYYKEDDVDDKKRESNCGGIIQVNVDFRYTIVRIVPELADYCSFRFEFNVEIFSSETGKWTEMVVQSPHEFCLLQLNNSGGVAYNGMLYWWSAGDHFIIGLDPYSNNGEGERPRFRLIDVPGRYGEFPLLSVCRGGRLRICHFFTWVMFGVFIPSMSVWELKDDGSEEGGEWCNLTGSISLRAMVFEHPLTILWGYDLMDSIRVLAFDPNNEDIMYLELFDGLFEHIMTCNIREKKLKETTLTTMYNSMVPFGRGVFPFVLPKWPTPLPRQSRRKQEPGTLMYSAA